MIIDTSRVGSLLWGMVKCGVGAVWTFLTGGAVFTALLTIGLAVLIFKPVSCHWPVPGPGPEPTPTPVSTKGWWIVGITDNANRTQDQAAILMDVDLKHWLDEQLAPDHYRIFDVGGSAYARYQGDVQASHLTPPCMLLYDETGKFQRGAVAPKTSDDVKSFVQARGPPTPHQPDAPTTFVSSDGHVRYLTCLPSSKAAKHLPRGGRWSDANPVIPRNQWKVVNRRSVFPADQWIYDQDGIGACVGNGSTDGLRKIRVLNGAKDVRLAPGCTYAQINGGHDDGAVISDSLTALQETGTISAATLGSDQRPFYINQLPSGWKEEAKRYRIEEAYRCETFDEMVSALQLGYIVVYGMQVGSNFERFTGDGVAGASSGPGNHCMHADGCYKTSSGAWAVDNCNSWGASWGPWHNGRCGLVQAHFENGDQPDAYAIKTAVEDPTQPVGPKATHSEHPPKPDNRHDWQWSDDLHDWFYWGYPTARPLYEQARLPVNEGPPLNLSYFQPQLSTRVRCTTRG